MASAGSAVLITGVAVILVGRLLLLLLLRGRWARTPWRLLLLGGRTVMVSLGLIGLRRDDGLTGKGLEIRVSGVIRLLRIEMIIGKGRLGVGVLRLMVGVVWIRP